jgi:hypothetical protein
MLGRRDDAGYVSVGLRVFAPPLGVGFAATEVG